MSEKTLPVTAAGFEKVFTTAAAKRPRRAYRPLYATDWREVAWAALERKKLGTLQRATEALSARYLEVLFLHDLKNLNAAETAWVLEITVSAVRSRLRKARMQMRAALASGLLPKLRKKTPTVAIPARTRFPAISGAQPLGIRFLSRRQN